ncbi:MAG: PQQ-binding-like beta-propeller repeat protein, partial [Planctomycetota bacterium]
MFRRPMATALVAAALATAGLAAQVDLPLPESSLYLESSRETEKLLEAARQAAGDRQWRKAIDLYQQAVAFVAKPRRPGEPPAQPLLPSPDDPALHLPVQDAAGIEVARLPDHAVELYRTAHDAAARDALESALADKNTQRLARTARRYPASTYGAQALAALGAIAFERGDPVGALAAWQRLLATGPKPGQRLLSIRARMWLCYRALGRTADAQALAEKLLADHGEETIELAGRLASVAEFLERPVSAAAPPPVDERPVLGGDASHARLPQGVDEVGEAMWTRPVEAAAVTDAGRRAFERRGLPVPHVLHPTVSDGRLFVANDATVYARDAATGRAAWMYPDGPLVSRGLRLGEAVHAPACAAGRVFVRLEDGVAAFEAASGRLLWRRRFERRERQPREEEEGADEGDEAGKEAPLGSRELVFATPPVPARGLVVFGRTALGEEAESELVALDARDGQEMWRTFLCSRSLAAFLAMGAVGNPPAVAGGTVYYCSNLGALAAVDLRTGRIRWVRRYTAYRGRLRQSIIERSHRWANNPVVVHRGLVFAAPQDCAWLLAVDAVDGGLAWKVPRAGGRYLVGAEGDRLLTVGREAVALDVRTAKRLWATPVEETLAGRPALCPGRMFIPTERALLAAATHSGQVAVARLWADGERPGNVILAGGRIFVAACDRVHAFEDWIKTRSRLEARRTEHPADPSIPLAYGTHALRRGEYEEAASLLEEALDRASAEPVAEHVVRPARRRLFAAYRGIGDAAALRKALRHTPTPEAAARTRAAMARRHERADRGP